MLMFSYHMFLVCVIFVVLVYPSVSSFFLNFLLCSFCFLQFGIYNILFTLCHPTSEMDFIIEDKEIYFELVFNQVHWHKRERWLFTSVDNRGD